MSQDEADEGFQKLNTLGVHRLVRAGYRRHRFDVNSNEFRRMTPSDG
jgi:hypothetical protein